MPISEACLLWAAVRRYAVRTLLGMDERKNIGSILSQRRAFLQSGLVPNASTYATPVGKWYPRTCLTTKEKDP